jgi:hypothetical protein
MSLHSGMIGARCLTTTHGKMICVLYQHSGHATTRSSIMGDNVPPCIQSRIDTWHDNYAAARFGVLTSWGRWAVDFDFKRQNSIVAALNEWPPTVYAACLDKNRTTLFHYDIAQ